MTEKIIITLEYFANSSFLTLKPLCQYYVISYSATTIPLRICVANRCLVWQTERGVRSRELHKPAVTQAGKDFSTSMYRIVHCGLATIHYIVAQTEYLIDSNWIKIIFREQASTTYHPRLPCSTDMPYVNIDNVTQCTFIGHTHDAWRVRSPIKAYAVVRVLTPAITR